MFGSFYWDSNSSDARYEKSLSALKNSGELVDVTVLGDIRNFLNLKRQKYDIWTVISYTDVITNKVVKRYVNKCGRYSERPTMIGCIAVNDEPLKMLYVPGNDKMWASCIISTRDKDVWNCSTYESTHADNAPFTFDVEQFKKN